MRHERTKTRPDRRRIKSPGTAAIAAARQRETLQRPKARVLRGSQGLGDAAAKTKTGCLLMGGMAMVRANDGVLSRTLAQVEARVGPAAAGYALLGAGVGAGVGGAVALPAGAA